MAARINFDYELSVLKSRVAEMATTVEKNYTDLFQALHDRNEEEIVRIKKND